MTPKQEEETAEEATNQDEAKHVSRVKSFVCEFCRKQYKHKFSLARHIEAGHKRATDHPPPSVVPKAKDPVMACQWPDCGHVFPNRTLFLRHYSTHNESRKVCSKCGLKCDDWHALREHMLGHHVPQFRCSWISCDFACSDRVDFLRHVAKHEGPYCCAHSNCSYKTSTSAHLEWHEKSAHEKVYIVL